jgi:hypothetical protein
LLLTELRVDLSEHPLVELVDGSVRPDCLQVTALQRPGQSPRIEVEPESGRSVAVLTAGEAHQLVEGVSCCSGRSATGDERAADDRYLPVVVRGRP